jgi:hypothetical protein
MAHKIRHIVPKRILNTGGGGGYPRVIFDRVGDKYFVCSCPGKMRKISEDDARTLTDSGQYFYMAIGLEGTGVNTNRLKQRKTAYNALEVESENGGRIE